jgi:pyruvate/2-oxoglutarate/acetoin dehydrogenase E1 component/TPP-dependent pyruvate/acetoin dehydrogenase alpha subunit
MPTFRDTEHLYRVLGALFERIQREPAISASLSQGALVVRFVFKDPEGAITVDLRREPISFALGPCDLKPDVEMTQSGDVAHLFWLGRLKVPQAIATRKVIARGSVPKALALLPAVKPVFSLYPQVLREIGEETLIPIAKPGRRGRKRALLSGLLGRRSAPKAADVDALNAHPIPLQEEAPDDRIVFKAQKLPVEEEALKIEMLRRMHLIRAFEQALGQGFATGTVPTEAVHLSVGQEACAVGACFALEEGDLMGTTHRGHGHMIARGAGVKEMAAELFGKASGLCGGLGGSMHVTDARLGALGANGIVGASSLIAVGAALSSWLRGTDQVALALMGDGATAQGMFHEALNFAAVFNLPAILFVENNQYAEFTPVAGHSRLERLSERAAGHGVPGVSVDGNDVWAVYDAVREAALRARRGEGPTLIEGITYRWTGHSEGESARYRTEEEIAAWKAKDPIASWRGKLIAEGIIQEAEAAEFEREAEAEVEEAMTFAQADAEPEEASITAHIFSPEPAALYRETPKTPATREKSVSAALFEALSEELARDESVYLIGEDVRGGGYFAVPAGLVDTFGPKRIIDTPISEYAIVGSSVGAAMTGMRPVAEIEFSDFITCCMDPLVNQAAKLRFMSGGQYRLPLVVRTPGGGGIGMAAQHSQSLEAWLLHIPGLIVMAPSTPYDAKGLLKAAIRSNNPVVFFENKLLYTATGPVPEEEYLVPIGRAEVKRNGTDVTLVAIGAMIGTALEAAEALARDGIDVEVVDPLTLFPCDWATLVRSALKTRRVVVLEGGSLTCGFGAECSARVTEAAWGVLKAPVKRVAAWDVPIPYNRTLENLVIPDAGRVVGAIQALLA